MAENTRELVFNVLWLYVKNQLKNVCYILQAILFYELAKLQSVFT